MATAASCIGALGALHAVPVPMLAALHASKGHAFQAFVFDVLGEELAKDAGWAWEHPLGAPSYRTSAGGSLHRAVNGASYCRRQSRLWLQELTVVGESGAAHHLDAALVQCPWPVNVQHMPDEPLSAGWPLGVCIECKNYGDLHLPHGVGMSVAREVVGLAMDLGARSALISPRRVFLVSAHGVSSGAIDLVEAHGQSVYETTHPGAGTHWVRPLRRRLRFPRRV